MEKHEVRFVARVSRLVRGDEIVVVLAKTVWMNVEDPGVTNVCNGFRAMTGPEAEVLQEQRITRVSVVRL